MVRVCAMVGIWVRVRSRCGSTMWCLPGEPSSDDGARGVGICGLHAISGTRSLPVRVGRGVSGPVVVSITVSATRAKAGPHA